MEGQYWTRLRLAYARPAAAGAVPSSFELSPPLVYCSCTEEHQDWQCTWCTRFYKVSDGADDKKEEEEEEKKEDEEVEKKNKDKEDKV